MTNVIFATPIGSTVPTVSFLSHELWPEKERNPIRATGYIAIVTLVLIRQGDFLKEVKTSGF